MQRLSDIRFVMAACTNRISEIYPRSLTIHRVSCDNMMSFNRTCEHTDLSDWPMRAVALRYSIPFQIYFILMKINFTQLKLNITQLKVNFSCVQIFFKVMKLSITLVKINFIWCIWNLQNWKSISCFWISILHNLIFILHNWISILCTCKWLLHELKWNLSLLMNFTLILKLMI